MSSPSSSEAEASWRFWVEGCSIEGAGGARREALRSMRTEGTGVDDGLEADGLVEGGFVGGGSSPALTRLGLGRVAPAEGVLRFFAAVEAGVGLVDRGIGVTVGVVWW